MISLTFGLFTQVSGSGPLGPLVYSGERFRAFRPSCFFVRFGFFIKKIHCPDSLNKKISLILAAPPPTRHKINSLMHHTLDTCSVLHCQ